MARVSGIRVFAVALAVAAGTLSLSVAEAKEGPLYQQSKTAKMTRKFCRGVGNSLFFWAEVPRSVFKKASSADPFTGFFYGIGEGFEQGAKRLGFGLWETVTFYSPCNRAYKPYIEPEFVLMDEG